MAYLWNNILNHDSSNCTLCKQYKSSSIESQKCNLTTTKRGIWNSMLNHNSNKCTLCNTTKITYEDSIDNQGFKPTKQMNLQRSKVVETLKAQMSKIMGKKEVTSSNCTSDGAKTTVQVEYVNNDYIEGLMKTAVIPSNESPATSNRPLEISILNFTDSLISEAEKEGNSSSKPFESNIGEEILCTAPLIIPTISKLSKLSNNDSQEEISTDEEVEVQEVSMAVLNCHECEKCQKQFVDWKEFKFHKELCGLVYPFLCQTCGHSVPNESGYLFHLSYHKKMITDHKCGYCLNFFCTEGALRTHLKLKNPCKNVKTLCKSCGLQSENEERYEAHHSSCTKRRIKFVCKICNNELGRKASLDRHIKLVHEREKFKNDFVCDSCGKTFPDRCALRKHMMKHAERKYKCFECGRKFIYIGNLKTHMKIHIREMNLEQAS